MTKELISAFENILKFIENGGRITIGPSDPYPFTAEAMNGGHNIAFLIRLEKESEQELIIRFNKAITTWTEQGITCHGDKEKENLYIRNRFSEADYTTELDEFYTYFKKTHQQHFFQKRKKCNLTFEEELKKYVTQWQTLKVDGMELQMINWWASEATATQPEKYLGSYKQAFGYLAKCLLLAQYQYWDKALEELKHAMSHWKRALDIATDPAFSEENNHPTLNSIGGKARAAIFQPVKDEVIRLLEGMHPTAKCKTKTAAIREIQPRIELMINDSKIPLSPEGLHRRILTWAKEDVNVSEAFKKFTNKYQPASASKNN